MQLNRALLFSSFVGLCACVQTTESVASSEGQLLDGGRWGGPGSLPVDAGSQAGATLRLTLAGLSPHAGRSVRAKAVSESSAARVDATESVPPTGNVSFTFTHAGFVGDSARVDFFVDLNGNGACDACGEVSGEPAWRRPLPDAAPRTVEFVVDTNFTDISPF